MNKVIYPIITAIQFILILFLFSISKKSNDGIDRTFYEIDNHTHSNELQGNVNYEDFNNLKSDFESLVSDVESLESIRNLYILVSRESSRNTNDIEYIKRDLKEITEPSSFNSISYKIMSIESEIKDIKRELKSKADFHLH
tara:strand:- start:56 stop:478 length:423 start_codon:yes stop_codon:yes gene_type:complete